MSDYWPYSEIDQQVFIAELEARLLRLRNSIKPLVVHKYTVPTQSDWERQWVSVSGSPPPIPPGLRLLWYDLSSGQMRPFYSCHNLANGTDSDGTVYPAKADNADGDCFRFLGTIGRNGSLESAFFKGDNTTTTLYLNQELWRQRGLLRLIVEVSLTGYNVRTAHTDTNDFQQDPVNYHAYSDYYPYFQHLYGINAKIVGATSTPTVNDNPILYIQNNASYVNSVVGQVIIDLNNHKDQQRHTFAPNILFFGATATTPATPSTSEMYMNLASWDIGEVPIRITLGDDYATAGEAVNKLNRGWVYGIFSATQDQELSEF